MTLPRRRGATLAVAGSVALAACASAAAGVIVSPSKPPANEAQLFTLVAQTDSAKAGRRVPMSQVDLFVPQGFAVDSFEPTAGWEQDWTVQSAIQKSTWTRDEDDLKNENEREEASEQDAVFHFVGRARPGRTYDFTVRQTYDDGTVVQWGPDVAWPGGPKQSAGPGPVVDAADPVSSSDGGTGTLALFALAVGALGLVTGAAALVVALRRRRA